MRYLLDTCVLLWWLEGNRKLNEEIIDTISTSQMVFVSAATQWEISIKRSLGKLKIPDNLDEELTANDFIPLDIKHAHAKLAGRLPKHHSDPFDRMLIAQAKLEDLVFITADNRTKKYDCPLLFI